MPLVTMTNSVSEYSWKEFCDDTSLHGLKAAFVKSKGHKRKLWLLCLLISFGSMVAGILSLSLLLAEPPIVTNIQVVQQSSIQFPDVTICNVNQISKAAADENPIIKRTLVELNPEFETFLFDVGDTEVEDVLPSNSTIENVFIESAQDLNDLILFSTWKQGWIATEQYADQFEKVVTDMGVCYTATGKKLKRQADAVGLRSGYSFTINVNTSDYYANIFLLQSAGVKVYVHNRGQLDDMMSRGIGIPIGTEAHLSVSKRIRKFDKRTGCFDSPTNPLKYSDAYSVGACFRECEAEFLNQSCGCKDFTFPGSFPMCTTKEDGECFYNASYQFSTNDQIRKACDCKIPCEEIIYDMSVSQLSYPSAFYKNSFKQWLHSTENNPHYKDSIDIYKRWYSAIDEVILLYVFFKDLNVEVVEQTAGFTLTDFVSNLGGTLGIFFGASFFSILELLDYSITTLFIKLKNIGNETKVADTSVKAMPVKSGEKRPQKPAQADHEDNYNTWPSFISQYGYPDKVFTK